MGWHDTNGANKAKLRRPKGLFANKFSFYSDLWAATLSLFCTRRSTRKFGPTRHRSRVRTNFREACGFAIWLTADGGTATKTRLNPASSYFGINTVQFNPKPKFFANGRLGGQIVKVLHLIHYLLRNASATSIVIDSLWKQRSPVL
jgi:hypothetical protein